MCLDNALCRPSSGQVVLLQGNIQLWRVARIRVCIFHVSCKVQTAHWASQQPFGSWPTPPSPVFQRAQNNSIPERILGKRQTIVTKISSWLISNNSHSWVALASMSFQDNRCVYRAVSTRGVNSVVCNFVPCKTSTLVTFLELCIVNPHHHLTAHVPDFLEIN